MLQADVFGPLDKVILAVGMMAAAVPMQKDSRREPAAEAAKSSDIVRVRSVVQMRWLMLWACCGRVAVVGRLWEERTKRTDLRVRPGKIVPSSGGATTSRSVGRVSKHRETRKYG